MSMHCVRINWQSYEKIRFALKYNIQKGPGHEWLSGTPVITNLSPRRIYYHTLFGHHGCGCPMLCLPNHTGIYQTPSRHFRTTFHLRKENEEDKKSNNNNNNNNYNMLLLGISGAVLFLASLFLQRPGGNRVSSTSMSWNELVEKVLPTGFIKLIWVYSDHHAMVVLHPNAIIRGKKVATIDLKSLSNTSRLKSMLREEEKKLNIDPVEAIEVYHFNKSAFQNVAITLLATVVAVAILGMFLKRRMKDLEAPMKMLDPTVKFSGETNVKFKDIAGMKEAKQEVMEFVDFLKNPERYSRLGAKMPRGCLLTGPPGVGKTMLAKSVASEAGVHFIAKAGSDFVEMIGGLGAKRIRQLFQKARSREPCIIYIDELDALGVARSGANASQSNPEKEQTVNQLLVEMDGMFSKKHRVIVLASTNRADILDKAILRPGRFDRIVQIDLPTRIEREEILLKHLRGINLAGDDANQFARSLASMTPGMSGADLANVCNEAAIYAARIGDEVVTVQHLDYAVERVIAGAPKSVSSVSPEEREVVAVHESGHALIGWLLEHTDALAKVTIIPRTKAALGFARTVPSDRHLHTKEQLSDYMCMALGGRAAEDLVKGHVTQGAQDDLRKVTDMAYAQVKHLGFNDVVGPMSFQDSHLRPYSDAFQNIMDQEVLKMVKAAYTRAKSVLSQNRNLLDALSRELLSRETMNYEDVKKVLGQPPFGDKNMIQNVPFGPFSSESEGKSEKKDTQK